MSRRRNEDASIELTCIGRCEDPPTWMVEGRFNADGKFEPADDEETDCPECFDRGEPSDPDTELADLP